MLLVGVLAVGAAGCSATAPPGADSSAVGGCADAPPVEDSIGNYQRALDATPYDEAGAWFSHEKYNALVADSPDPAARAVEAPAEPGTRREVLTTGARRTEPDGSRHPPALLAGYSGDLYTVKVKPVDTHITRIEHRPRSTGRPVPVEPATALGPVLLELYDRQGALVLSRWYPLVATHGDFGPEGGPTWSEHWDVHVDRPPQWSCLRMLADASLPPGRDSTVIEVAASPNPPTVEITAPRRGRVLHTNEPVEVSWTASDPDGDALTYRPQVSFDGGETWRSHVLTSITPTTYRYTFPRSGAADTRYTFPSSDADTLRFRVIASDGARTAAAVSPVFRVEPPPPSPNAPVVEFASLPQPGRALSAGDTVEVAWTASDPDGDSLSFEFHYSTDRGATYHDTGYWATQPSLGFHISQSIAESSSTLRFKVVATDGTHRTGAESPDYRLQAAPGPTETTTPQPQAP